MNRHVNRLPTDGWRWLVASLLAAVLLLAAASGGAAAPLNQPEAPLTAGQPPQQAALEDPEAAYAPDYLHLATGPMKRAAEATRYAWPFTLRAMGHTIASYQNYGSDPYFHHGLDILADAGTQVYNRSGGQVVNIENYQPGNALYWEVAVLDPEGYLWQYHHVDRTTIPQAIFDKYNEYKANPTTGGFIPPNTYIGNIVYWSVVSFGERFNHIHLNILGSGGYVNGFDFLAPLNDTSGPQIQTVGLMQGGQILPGSVVAGGYSLYARKRDLILHTQYYVPPNEVTIAVDGGPAQTVWRFDNLPGGFDKNAYVSQFFISPTCGNYSCRDFYIDLGFIPGSLRAFPRTPGSHSAVVTVRDYAGNSASQTFNWTTPGPPAGNVVFFENFEGSNSWTRNPSGSDTATSGLFEVGNPQPTNSSGPKQLDLPISDHNALVTGAAAGASASSNDVDGGRTSMRSPNITLPNVPDLTLSFYSYLAHTASNSSDYLRVTVVGPLPPNGGAEGATPADTVVWQETGVNSDRDAVWAYHQADISGYAGQTIYLLVEAADPTPDTTVLEAAVDDIQITTASPLAALLAGFEANAQADHVLVSWETVSEANNAGFNLYRSLSADGEYTLLGFTPSASPGGTAGAAYSYQDFDVVAGQVYWYKLEDIALSGAATMHGPVSILFQAPTAVTLSGLEADGGQSNALTFELMAGLLAVGAFLFHRRRGAAI